MRNGDSVQFLGEQRVGASTMVAVRVETLKGPVHLCIEDVAWNPEQRFVVMVDGGRLARTWRQELGNEHTGFDWEQPGTWSKDHKYARADAELPNDERDPLALAKVRCELAHVAAPASGLRRLLGMAPPAEPRVDIFLEDGVTRTLWLLRNGARILPMECRSLDDARRLAQAAGVPDAPVRSVAQLRAELRAPLRRSA